MYDSGEPGCDQALEEEMHRGAPGSDMLYMRAALIYSTWPTVRKVCETDKALIRCFRRMSPDEEANESGLVIIGLFRLFDSRIGFSTPCTISRPSARFFMASWDSKQHAKYLQALSLLASLYVDGLPFARQAWRSKEGT